MLELPTNVDHESEGTAFFYYCLVRLRYNSNHHTIHVLEKGTQKYKKSFISNGKFD